MALTQCRECKNEISKAAKACPKCGAKPRRTSMFTWFCAVIAVCWMIGHFTDPHYDPMTSSVKHQDAAADPVKETRYLKTAIVAKKLKNALRDPSSLEWITMLADKDATTICLEYRARNGFGGMNIENFTVYKGTSSTSAASWNRHCANKDLFDMKYVRLAI